MSRFSVISLVALLLSTTQALVLGPAGGAVALRPPAAGFQQARAQPFKMLTEEEEYEEFVKKKLGAVKKLGSDENFAEYRQAESTIYKVGGACPRRARSSSCPA
jgi:hypothetical protein|eukprot:1412657-Prymnesium_polylepis.1